MTRKELKEHCEKQIEMQEIWAIGRGEELGGKIYEEHKMILELLEQTTWIPVSERLPEEDGRYLVTNSKNEVVVYVYNSHGNSEEYYKRCVVAWMPLPEPFKEEGE